MKIFPKLGSPYSPLKQAMSLILGTQQANHEFSEAPLSKPDVAPKTLNDRVGLPCSAGGTPAALADEASCDMNPKPKHQTVLEASAVEFRMWGRCPPGFGFAHPKP